MHKKAKTSNSPLNNNQRLGKWSDAEHNLMLRFVRMHKKQILTCMQALLKNNVKRLKGHFFKKMAKFIGSKSEIQCKSRYQKQEVALLQSLDVPPRILHHFMEKQADKRLKSHLERAASKEEADAAVDILKMLNNVFCFETIGRVKRRSVGTAADEQSASNGEVKSEEDGPNKAKSASFGASLFEISKEYNRVHAESFMEG